LKKIFVVIIFLLIAADLHAKDYVIGDGDSFEISVWGNSQLTSSVTVRPDGKISLPALGEIIASGLTPKELTDLLEEEMKSIIKTPIVSVIMSGMKNYRVYIFGRGTAATGVRQLDRKTTLLELLCDIGKIGAADLESAYLLRNKEKIKTDFSELFEDGDISQDIVLESNDMLFIPDNYEKKVSIFGAVGAPTAIPYRKGLTMLDIIVSIGGFNEFAKENDVQIFRKSSSGERVKIRVYAKDLMKGEMDKNVEIMPGDFILVKESLF